MKTVERQVLVAVGATLLAVSSGSWFLGLMLAVLISSGIIFRLHLSCDNVVRSLEKARRRDLEAEWKKTWNRLVRKAGMDPAHCALIVYNGDLKLKSPDLRGFCCGYGKKLAVLISTETLRGPYALGVLAHELAHAKGQHGLWGQAFLVGIYLLGLPILFGLSPTLGFLGTLALALAYFIGAESLRKSMQRHFEYQADAFSEQLYPEQLQRALNRNLEEDMSLFDDHPSNAKRINRLAR